MVGKELVVVKGSLGFKFEAMKSSGINDIQNSSQRAIESNVVAKRTIVHSITKTMCMKYD